MKAGRRSLSKTNKAKQKKYASLAQQRNKSGKFKMQTSRSINILRDTPETPNWQPNYHDHVIRNRPAFERIKRYIILNPEKWEDDTFYEDGEA